MKILGIDPGFAIVGWSVIDNDLKIHGYGTITTPPENSFDDRLLLLHKALKEIINIYNPQVAVLEKLFFQKNSKTVIDVAKAIGVITLTISMFKINIFEYTPTEVKHCISGYGRATKQQVQLMMKKIFRIKNMPAPDDAADALAIALCHTLKSK